MNAIEEAQRLLDYDNVEYLEPPLYDTLFVQKNNPVKSLNFFTDPCGPKKSRELTNLWIPNTLPIGQSHLTQGIAINSDAPESFYENGLLSFLVGSKCYLEVAPLSMFRRYRVKMKTIDGADFRRNSYNPFPLNPPLMILEGMNFSIQFSWSKPQKFSRTFRVRIELLGILFRPVV